MVKRKVTGLKARGNFEISDLEWKNGKITKLEIKSFAGGQLNLLVPQDLKGKLHFVKEGNLYRSKVNMKTGETLTFVNKK